MRTIKGSVKDVSVIIEPTDRMTGVGDCVFSRRYSIFDLKRMPDEIQGREALGTIAAFNFELLENSGVRTHYGGVVNQDGKVVTLGRMQEAPARMRIRLARVFEPETKVVDGKLVFSYEYLEMNRGTMNNYVIPIEWIYRNGLPQGSSVLRDLRKAGEKGDREYVERQLKKLGLTEMPGPNTMLPKPYGNYTTKYEPLGDRGLGDDHDALEAINTRDYNKSEAVRISGLTHDEFDRVIADRNKVATIIRKRGKEVGIDDWDGKLEFLWFYGPMVGDVAGSPDENRWFYDGQQVSKEILRQLYDIVQPGLRKDIERAQREAAEDAVRTGRLRDWREYLKVHPVSLDTINPYIIPLVGEMHTALSNQWTGIPFYKARSLGAVMKDLDDVVKDVAQRYGG